MKKDYNLLSGLLASFLFAFILILPSKIFAQGLTPCTAEALVFTSGEATVSGSTVDKPDNTAPAQCGGFEFYYQSPGVWYKFEGTGNDFEIRTCGSDFDTRLRVYSYLLTPDCSALFCGPLNDNSDECGIGSDLSYIKMSTIPNKTYYILLDGTLFADGNYQLNVKEDLPVPTCTLSILETSLSGFCQGGVELSAVATEPGATFTWTVDSDPLYSVSGESIRTTLSGTYTVTASNGDCDGLTASYSLSVTPQDLLSAYTILATEEVHLHGNAQVVNGGVGVLNTNEELKVHEASTIVGTTTFGIAPLFDITNGSVVTNQITGNPGITLPDFLVMPYGTMDVEVPENGFYQATGVAYHKVKLKKNATIVFTQDNVSIKEFETDDNSTVKFSGCTYLYIDKKMKMDKGTLFNPENFEVTAYVANSGKDKVEVKEGSVFNGNVYATGEIKAKGKEPKDGNPAIHTYMNGMFIGKKVKGEKYAVYNWDLNCDNTCTASGSVPTNKMAPATQNLPIAFEINAYPNPFTTSFEVEIFTNSDAPVDIAVYTTTGIRVERFERVSPSEVFQIGEKLSKGMYIVMVSQNGKTTHAKMIKN